MVVNVFVHVDTLRSDADLTTVEESADKHLLGSFGHIALLGKYNARVVASKLEGETLESGRARLGNELASLSTAGK